MGIFKAKPIMFSRELRRFSTKTEQVLWSKLRNRQLNGMHFRRQHPIGPYIADFACIRCKLIIEADGGQHAENDHDVKRDEFLSRQGWRVLRFWNNEINENLEGVMQIILSHTPTLPLPRKRERE